MESEVRENMSLAHYNFNKMAVIDEEEGIENNGFAANQSRGQGSRQNKDNYAPLNSGQELKQIKNMHNTTSGFYP